MCGVKGKESEEAGGKGAVCNGDNGDATKKSITLPIDSLINLDHGDPKIFKSYWSKNEDRCNITFKASELLSYFSDPGSMCWFMEPQFTDSVKRLHAMVGNAVTENRHLVVGTGSSQLYQAALYAIASTSNEDALPLKVVSSTPYYSNYPELTDMMKSGLYKWGGDANVFKSNKNEPYIEVVCSPNNPDGTIKKPEVKNGDGEGKFIHDFAYYWPHYTPITCPADHDIMLFTVSKCTGHAGSRIGWAIVKDEVVARKMSKFVELNTIGTSKEAQLRAAKILNTICDDYLDFSSPEKQGFFEHGYNTMVERWERLRDTMKHNAAAFTLLEFPESYCQFMGKFTRATPGFAWIECKEGEDGAAVMREHKILARSGERFGVDKKYVRISMFDTDDCFNLFLSRLATM